METYSSILFNIWETHKEQMLAYKCRELLNYYSKEKIVENSEDSNFFNRMFVNNVISSDDINFILLKKYYIGGFETKNSTFINYCIKMLDFDSANLQLTKNSKLRGEFLNIYLENIDVSNADLYTMNNYGENYNNFSETLSAMDKYYKDLKENSTIKIHSLKKSYN